MQQYKEYIRNGFLNQAKKNHCSWNLSRKNYRKVFRKNLLQKPKQHTYFNNIYINTYGFFCIDIVIHNQPSSVGRALISNFKNIPSKKPIALSSIFIFFLLFMHLRITAIKTYRKILLYLTIRKIIISVNRRTIVFPLSPMLHR